MFPASSPTFGKLKCPSIDSNRPCPFESSSGNSRKTSECVFSHDSEVYRKGDSDGKTGLSSLTYYKDLQKRIRSEQAACKASQLFDHKNDSNVLNSGQATTDAILKASENNLINFLHRAPAGYKISTQLREKVLLKLVKAMRAADATCSLAKAADIEHELLLKGGPRVTSIYLSAVADYIKRIEKQDQIPKSTSVTSKSDEYAIKYEDLRDIVASRSSLDLYTYPLIGDEASKTILVECSKNGKSCRRCGIKFVPSTYYEQEAEQRGQPCRFHGGRVEKLGGLRVYSCCQAPIGDANGCETHNFHVFEGFNRGDPTPRFPELDLRGGAGAVALDAEMCYTRGGYEASRLTIVDFFSESTLLDVLVRPRCPPVIDYNTKWSGVDAQSFIDGKMTVMTFEEAQQAVASIVGPETILIGHSLDNDLKVLEFSHDLIVDTAILYPHRAGNALRLSLKSLALAHLSELVQQSLSGHDSREDCVTCIKLVKMYLKGKISRREPV